MNREQTETLLKRYLDGDTTNAEEQRLRHYFTTTPAVPAEWKAYKALFLWEASGQHSEERMAAEGLMPGRRTRWRRMALAAGIAALLLAGVGMTLRSWHPLHADRQNYAVLDGRRTTDADIVAREAEEALLVVSATDDDTFDAIDCLAIP